MNHKKGMKTFANDRILLTVFVLFAAVSWPSTDGAPDSAAKSVGKELKATDTIAYTIEGKLLESFHVLKLPEHQLSGFPAILTFFATF